MKFTKPKTLDDFPKFVATAVRSGATFDTGYQSFEIEGRFDLALEGRFDLISEGTGAEWFWLLYGEHGCLTPTLKSFDKKAGTAILTCAEKDEPRVLGLELTYLSPCWQAFHIWMVLDPNWGWQRRQFHGIDASAEDYEAKEVSIVGGREVRIWTKLEPTANGHGQSRHYPAIDQTLPVRDGARLVPGGWGHEHCALCNEPIDAGRFGYCDNQERWMCEKCYHQYAARHDLAFVDDL